MMVPQMQTLAPSRRRSGAYPKVLEPPLPRGWCYGALQQYFLSVVIIGESGNGDVVKSVRNVTNASNSVSCAPERRFLIAIPA